MGKGTIYVEGEKVFKWFIEGNRLEDVKELLLLPENFTVEKVFDNSNHASFFLQMGVIVSSSDIPQIVPDRETDARLELEYEEKDGKTVLSCIKAYPNAYTIPAVRYDMEK